MEDKIKILLVDDKPDNLFVLENILESPELDLVTATSGNDALELVLEHEFALILLDVQMPGMNGYETAELLRGFDKTCHIPIIFITAINKEEKYIFKGYQSGAVDYLFKPVHPEILKSKVKIFLDLYRQQKMLEQQAHELKNVNKELNDFASIISHDLKAPLRAIRSLANWIAEDYADKLDDEGKEQIKMLIGRVTRMNELIDGVLQYSRVGRIREKVEAVDVNKVLSEVIDMIVSPEHITIDIENKMPIIYFEKTRITQVFQNLIGNAVKYMDKAKGIIKVGCVGENRNWKFHISDNGPGIDEKHFAKIFQIFQTLNPRDEVESTGVGLTIVKKILEMYGQKIWLESTPGSGSTFYFTISKDNRVSYSFKELSNGKQNSDTTD
ncbi:response regulator [candidate division KSB1 bacterium]|nr:response regulator [candidate division KSB1 bacterium]